MEQTVERELYFENKDLSAASLEHISVSEVWLPEEIEVKRKSLLYEGREWTVVDNLIIHDDIKIGSLKALNYISSYKQTLSNLAIAGIKEVQYNFTPVFFKLSTHLDCSISDEYPLPAFDPIAFAVFDIYILKRDGAEMCYNDYQRHSASLFNRRLSFIEKKQLEVNILQCIQDKRLLSRNKLLTLIDKYKVVTNQDLKRNLEIFQLAVLPFATQLGITMKLEKDWIKGSVLGLPTLQY